MDAGTLVNELDLPVRQHVENNEFLAAARNGRLDEKQVQRLVQVEFQTQEAEFATYPLLAVRFRHEVPAGLFVHVADTILRARRFLVRDVVGAVGLDVEELRRAPLSTATREAADMFSWMGLHAGAGEAALVARTDFLLWTAACAALLDVLPGSGVPEVLISYLEQYAEPPAAVVDGAVEVVDFALAAGEEADRVVRSAPGVEPMLGTLWHFAAAG
ncbi:hypothetical protein [Actinokineospora spheciospongiae]|uniref:hypothetical protein n=1 Tax=Actinokineospora spheciospongiae TaxID=909613 RepID=UPI000552C070|nr:hypothetical protein [Actinokineospora spheciospongiae]PWW62797.1 hypothetical protein DFQ13_105615 [Actinokineospora spheciospongiae]